MKFSTELLPTTPNYFQSSLQRRKSDHAKIGLDAFPFAHTLMESSALPLYLVQRGEDNPDK